MNEKKNTILLTGATGFLGSQMLEALMAEEHKVVILKRSTSDTWRIENLLSNVVSYDVDRQPLERVFEEHSIDIIIHFATLYRKFDNGKEVADMIQSNVTFPVELLEIGVRNKIKAFINTGTFFEYDCSNLPVRESADIKPFNLYAKTKVAFESILGTYSDKISINTFRLFSPYGKKDNQKLIPMLINKGLSDERISVSEGFQKLDFIYAEDVISAYIKAIERLNALNFENEYQIFNLGSGRPLSIREVVSVIEQELGYSLDVKWGEKAAEDIPIVFSDVTKLISTLAWKPDHSIQQGISKTISYYKGLNP
tara:strand:- start:12953 stop:13885 length:933 start_codon:yes stop_codon:yes gene_type:complete